MDWKSLRDCPTLGVVLCSETDEDIARYSILHGNEQLFASKYKLYLPTEEELREEIETQKAIFYLQQKEKSRRIQTVYNKVPKQINDFISDNVKKLAEIFSSAVKDGEVDCISQ